MPTAESVKAKLQSLIDQANATTGSQDADLTTAVNTLIAGFGQGGGGSMESGEFTATSATYYGFTIPVSSKKSHIIVYPKDLDTFMQSPPNKGRTYSINAIENEGIILVSLNQNYNETNGMNTGASYWYNHSVGSATAGATFTDTSIDVRVSYAPLEPGNYLWFAW